MIASDRKGLKHLLMRLTQRANVATFRKCKPKEEKKVYFEVVVERAQMQLTKHIIRSYSTQEVIERIHLAYPTKDTTIVSIKELERSC